MLEKGKTKIITIKLNKEDKHTTFRIEESLEESTRHAQDHHNVDSFHAYLRLLIRKDVKELQAQGIIPKSCNCQ